MDLTKRPIRYLKGVGEKRAGQFERLGVPDIGALLCLYPRRYIDYSSPFEIAAAPYDTPCVVAARVYAKAAGVRLSGGRTMVRVTAGDETATLLLTFFNNPWAVNALEPGKDYLFYGKVGGGLTRRDMTSPTFLPAGGEMPLVPVYPLTEGITSRVVATCVKNAFAMAQGDDDAIPDPLPPSLVEKYGFLSRRDALYAVHFPKSVAQAEEARRRLIFEELFLLQLGLLGLRGRERAETAVRIPPGDIAPFLNALPYALTGAQSRALGEILSDMAGPAPMSRLLQGDVGSGKTAVAAGAMFAAARGGWQSAMMAPTELLAAQHAETLEKMLGPLGISVALLTGSVKGAPRKATLNAIATGSAQVVVGTHALISEDVTYRRLGLVITDEQHRFGVRQRTALSQKGQAPHLLVMSATPIPRTLGLIIFGDLDISVLDELPAGRTPVKTYRVGTDKRGAMYGFLHKQIQSGRQLYIVCPAIEEGPLAVEAVTEYYRKVACPLLPGCRVALLHGKMKAGEKAAVMEGFRAGNIDALCSTTVIEVGMDVPNATVMVVENAERFGLSALHQLRGRVGRGGEESYCFLVSDDPSPPARERLALLCRTANGFEVARYDLKTRGPGDFFGKRQHGLPALRIADLAADVAPLQAAQNEAAALVAADPTLCAPEHEALRTAALDLFGRQADSLN